MKNAIRLFGVIALAAVIGFSMTGCPDADDDDKGKSGKTSFGDKLEFSNEQVYVNEAKNNYTVDYKPYAGADLTADNGVQIVGGKFSLSLEAPASNYLEKFPSEYTISDSTARYTEISSFNVNNSHRLIRENNVYKNIKTSGEKITSGSVTSERVRFMYVDKPVKITVKGHNRKIESDGYSYSWKSNDYTLSLAKGWNTVCYKTVTSYSSSGYSVTSTTSVSNPGSLKWVYEYNDD